MLSVDHSNIDGPPLAVKCVRKFGSALGGGVCEWVSEWFTDWFSDWLGEWFSDWSSEWMSEWEWVIEWVNGRGNEWVSELFFLKRTNKWLFSYVSCLSVEELNHSNIGLLRKSCIQLGPGWE